MMMMLCVNSIRNKHYYNSWPVELRQYQRQSTYWLLSIPTCSYLNGTIKIRGGSSWTVSLWARAALHTFVVQRTKWFADSLSCSHCEDPKKFVFSTQKYSSWPEAWSPCLFWPATLKLKVFGSAGKIWSWEERLLRDVFCDKQRNFTLKRLFQSSSPQQQRCVHTNRDGCIIYCTRSQSRKRGVSQTILYYKVTFPHRNDGHFLSWDLRRKRFSDQRLNAKRSIRRERGIEQEIQRSLTIESVDVGHQDVF